jgi:hypothetical protein
LLTALKEIDFYFYNFIRNEITETTSEHFYLMRLGLPRLAQKGLTTIPQYLAPVVTFKSDEKLILKTLEQVARFGMIQHGRRMAYASLSGDCDLVKVSESSYDFLLPHVLFNYEDHEEQIYHHYRRELAKLAGEENAELLQTISKLLSENVFVFMNHFIGYDADPLLDEYFFAKARSSFDGGQAFDTFKYDTLFGQLQYQHYYVALCYIVSLSLKHGRFCEALIAKHPEIRLRDILTISCEKKSFIESIKEGVNHFGRHFEDFSHINLMQAEQLFNVLSVRRDNLAILDHIDFPPLIQFSDVSVVRSVTGAQFQPGEFLLESLKQNFPVDYDKNQNKREASMQGALERILADLIPSIKTERNIVLRNQSRTLTDIDFAAYNELNHEVVIFQLKHQDVYGTDMKKRSSRGTRLREETRRWLAQVEEWFTETPEHEIRSTLQLKKGTRIDHFCFVAIGKNFAHFLSPLTDNPKFAYATWMQFYDAVTRMQFNEVEPKTLLQLFHIIQEYMTHKIAQPHAYEGVDEYCLEKVKFRTREKEKSE